MTSLKQKKSFRNSRPPTPTGAPSVTSPVKGSPFFRFEQAVKNIFRSTAQEKDQTVSNVLAAVPFSPITIALPPGHQDGDIFTFTNSSSGDLSTLTPNSPYTFHTPIASTTKAALSTSPFTASHPWLYIFPQNTAAPSPLVSLPPQGTRVETIVQLTYCNYLLRTQLSPSSSALSVAPSLNSVQQSSVDAILQDAEERSHIHWLTTRVVKEFVADSFKTSEKIAEVILLGPFLGQEHHRKLLNCLVTEFERARLMDIELLQGILQLVECAGSDYLLPDDLIHILAVLRTRLQDTHQQSVKHPYYLTLALSRLLDTMVEGKVQDLRRVVDQEPLLVLLRQLSSSDDPILKHQAVYTLQALLHIPNDETRRQFMLRQAGGITMGLLGVASVCKLDLGEFKDGVDHLYKVAGDAHEVVTKIVGGIQSLLESGQGITTSVKDGVLSGGRRLWYSALREAQEYIKNGRLADFNHLVFKAPCRGNSEFQWGICRLLGELAIDTNWDIVTRQHAIDLLATLYKDEPNWTTNNEVHSWILQLVRHVVALPELPISEYTQSTLQGLKTDGDATKQALCRDAFVCLLGPHILHSRLPTPESSKLLARVQGIPDVEYDVHRMRTQRLREREHVLYIPPQAKPSLQASNETLFPLMEHALDFLSSPRQVLLLLGDSGGGKSTFNLQLERTLWQKYKRGDAIPLHINLPAIDNPKQNMISKQLQQLNFSDVQIQELKQNREFIVICDGYDESQLNENLYAANQINCPGQWQAKIIITCRSQYLGFDYRLQFQPTVDRYAQVTPDHLQEAVLAPFSKTQIEQYIEQYVERTLPQLASSYQQEWSADDFMDKLVKIPHLIELVSNPFLLTLALRALPRVVRSEQDLSVIRLTRVELYDSFTEEWLENNKRRLAESRLSPQARFTFNILRDDGFVPLGISYQKDLSYAIFKHQEGYPVVEYSHLREHQTWKASFFSPDLRATILREASPLTRSGNHFRFIHRSILEYLYSRVLSDPFDGDQHITNLGSGNEEVSDSFLNHPLNQRRIVGEPSIMQFLAERVDLDATFKSRLFAVIEASKKDAMVSVAAANAISILVKAGVRFNGADLRGIRISGADVGGGEFDSADLEGADLSKVDLTKTWLRQSNLRKAHMDGVHFGELPYITLPSAVDTVVFSSDGEFLVVSDDDSIIHVYDTTTWSMILNYSGGGAIAASPVSREIAKAGERYAVEVGEILSGEPRLSLEGHQDKVTSIRYSADGNLLATASDDTTVRLWSVIYGEALYTLCGHYSAVTGVAFSPDGCQLVSCSKNGVVQIWIVETGEPLAKLEGHDEGILCVAYSPDGHQIAAGGNHRDAWIWDTWNWKIKHHFTRHMGALASMTFSGDSHKLVSGSNDWVVQAWDAHNGEILSVLYGHSSQVNSVVYTPSGDYIASGSWDGTVRIWKAGGSLPDAFSEGDRNIWTCIAISPSGGNIVIGGKNGELQLWESLTGKPTVILQGHEGSIRALAFSHCGLQIASAGLGTVKLWCSWSGECLHVLKGHHGAVFSLVFSPNDREIAHSGSDPAIRIWNAQTGDRKHILEGHTHEVMCVAYSPSGRQIASCGSDKTIRLWHAETGEQLHILNQDCAAYRVMYSLDEKELVLASSNPDTVSCWDLGSKESFERQEMSELSVTACCISPDRSMIATGDLEGFLRLWNRKSPIWKQVFHSRIGVTLELQWKQGPGCTYLSSIDNGLTRFWRLVETDGTFDLRLVWSTGMRELTFEGANLCGVVGLSPVHLKLVEQRGANTDSPRMVPRN